jgi:hypothetical protein
MLPDPVTQARWARTAVENTSFGKKGVGRDGKEGKQTGREGSAAVAEVVCGRAEQAYVGCVCMLWMGGGIPTLPSTSVAWELASF